MIRYYLYQIVQYLFLVYTVLLTARILVSWVPSWRDKTWVRFVSFYTDPYLGLFRKIVPPLGGMDFSPLLAFFALRILEMMVLAIIR